MKKNPRKIGDEHVKSVYQALLLHLRKKPITEYPETITQTVEFIIKLFPRITSVSSKFDHKNPDLNKDLTLTLESNQKVNINLFLIKKGGRIQPKNPGAKSFFIKYFLSEELQVMFNKSFEDEYLNFLIKLVDTKIGVHYLRDRKELRKIVSELFPRFTKEIEPIKNNFLYSLREVCFKLLKDFYNNKHRGFFNAYNVFFMTEDVNIITSYGRKDNDVCVEQFNPGRPNFNDIHLYKTGKYTVGIRYGEIALTLRFKFESSPVSSVKLATSYERFSIESEKELINKRTLQKMQELLQNHNYTQTSNSSNAIGKCHEAITYYYFLKEYPKISQVEPFECVELLKGYYSLVKPTTLQRIYNVTSTLIPVIRESLNKKYDTYYLDSIELIPDSYIQDRLETGDLQLILKVKEGYAVEKISLKAIAKKSSKITTKNPGIGTILGPTYFNIGSLESVVNEVKTRFQIGEISHKESLEIISEELGLRLSRADQEKLKKGIENLLGKAMMAITVYNDNINICMEHSSIEGLVNVYIKKPTAIQNTLAWSNDKEAINLRVKFSKRQIYGWSSIKLTSEYQIKF